MNEKLYKEKYEKIEVPQKDVHNAIKLGVQNASHKKKIGMNRWMVPAVAAVMMLVVSFSVPSLSSAFTNLPFLGQVYSEFNDMVGRDLASEQLITKLDETASDQGVHVQVTSAYFDGTAIGVTFEVTGKVNETKENDQLSSFYEIFHGDDGISDSKEVVQLKKTDQGYVGQIQTYYPKEDIGNRATLPIRFNRIGSQEGDWYFEVPINHLPTQTTHVNQMVESINGDIQVQFDKVVTGEASTSIDYSATFPASEKNNQVRLQIITDKGNKIFITKDGIELEKKLVNDQWVIKGRSIIPENIRKNTEYIKVITSVAIEGEDPNNPLILEPVKINIE
ncbi:DUF4179 domain-containing protein [Pontibacillus yanchengensis]|uniref:DUF4179 domain-containing protein n=2 Tax=Pontibacillus yanchengensis TaxID=462910 RepID=A0A6I4ZYL7_9BACI|nr:DUF4179 domain-containing protein [Pontibacillus yanchengensis]MYL34284.1 DUF4179 domain-containing protein [Pontibacillus yanchengensis]MYL55513.1 DUF4179 domain-containing protein [Pontibacillus yanchengensis]